MCVRKISGDASGGGCLRMNPVIKWKAHPTTPGMSLQRCTRVDFTNVHARVEDLDIKSHNLSYDNDMCQYVDNLAQFNQSYTYRVVIRDQHKKHVSAPTQPVFIHDVSRDIGYPGGAPAQVTTYNTTPPLLHLDTSRLINSCDRANQQVRSASTLIRHDHDNRLRNMVCFGEPLFDSCSNEGDTCYIMCKSNNTYNQANQTDDMINTHVRPVLNNSIDL